MGRTSIMEKKEAALKELEPLLESVSKLLKSGRFTDAHERHGLAFLEMELGAIVAYLRMPMSPSIGDHDDGAHYDLMTWMSVLIGVRNTVTAIVKFLSNQPCVPLRKATRRFRRRRSFGYDIPRKVYPLYLVFNGLRSELMPSPPQAAQVEACTVHDHLVAIDGTANELLGWLMAADESLRVMAIAGPAGIGKTTLAMELHRRLRCQTHFQCHIVANFSRRPHGSKLVPQTILKQIIEQLEAPSSPNSSEITMLGDDLELLARNISERLKDKRYFALIDNIFNESDLELIKGAFPNNNCGSRILFTAGDERIAGWCLSNYNGIVHKMKPLSHSDSEKLLHIKAFGSMDDCPPENLKLLCDEILMKCRGIPSFITGMADWLKQHQQQHGSSAIPRVEEVRLLLKQFEHWLSFDYSDELRQSLLYLSTLPQGYVFEKDRLVMKWLDEGLLSELHFSEMVDRNIITPAARNCGHNLDEDDLCLWQVNPFILRFLAYRAAEKGYAITSATLNSAPRGGGKNTRIARRLALHHPDPQLPEMLQEMDLSHTRSLLISGAVNRTTVPLDKFGYLVSLDLEGWENLKDEDLLQICKMLVLSYLSVSNTKVSKLPPQIKELRTLNALDISHTHISEIPSEVCEPGSLRMLDLRGTQIKHMPEQIVRLKMLKHFLIDLSEFSERSVKYLGDLHDLKILAITWAFHQCNDKAYQQALLSSLGKWRQLKSLTIHCGLGCSMEFLRSLSDPPKFLDEFKVTAGKFANVPQWIEGLEHLTFLQITVCKQVAGDVKILAGLVKLQRLILGLEFIPEEAIVIESKGFKELEKFSLDCPVPRLTFEEEAMPKLTYLRLNLHTSPMSEMSVPSGIGNLKMLSEVALCYNVRYMNSPNIKRKVEAVSKEVAKHRNPIDLFIRGMQIEVNQAGEEEAEGATRFNQVNSPEDVVQAADEAAPRRETEFQSEIEDEGETECHA
uniref:YNR2 n=1 Tax=Oryza sativa subsp. japonica TaxID=39947 RepID=Q58H63_ORYSJ|nr:YNR2 [Oryza sativa Japonica Group]